MTDQERLNSAMGEACAILSEHIESGHIRNPNATVNKLLAVLDRPELTVARERMEHAVGQRGRRTGRHKTLKGWPASSW
jgi:hypothetical protein